MMAVELKNHSDGTIAGVSQEHQLLGRIESHELQHHISWNSEEAFQTISVDTGITAKTQTIMHIINNSATKNVVISFIRFAAITNTASKPVVGEYFETGLGRTVASGGTETTPVNMNAISGKVAPVTVTGIDPTMAGTFNLIDRRYHQASGVEQVYNKQGSIILGLNDTFEVRFLSAGTGEAVCRVTFMMMDKDR